MMRGGRNPALFYYERTVRRWHTQTARWWLIRNLARTIPGSERTASTGSRLIALSASARRRDWETGLQHPAPRHPATTALTGTDAWDFTWRRKTGPGVLPVARMTREPSRSNAPLTPRSLMPSGMWSIRN